MAELLTQKFTDSDLRRKLLATGESLLEETNGWSDTFYGVCHGVGANHLGLLLMGVRAKIRAEGAKKKPKISLAKGVTG